MVIKIPQHHDFSQSFRKKVLDETGLSLPEWIISVPKNLDLEWSIVLAYLMIKNYRNRKDFSTRLKLISGINNITNLVNRWSLESELEKSKKEYLVERSIIHFNPFRNRCSCFYNETLKTVVNDFRKNVNWDNITNISDKLAIASKILKCQILFIDDYRKSENYSIFRDAKGTDYFIVLIKFPFEDEMSSSTIINFMIDITLGQKLKKAALRYYLKETDIPKYMLRSLTDNVAKEDTFIKAVLNSRYENAILEVYKSPYVISKLVEAGYEMDPRTKDSDGFCGLFHALALENTEILYKLYYFAVFNCCQTNLNPNIVSNLQSIEEILQENISKFKDSNRAKTDCIHIKQQQNSDMERKLQELLKLNKFLIEFNRKNLKIKNRLNYYETTSDVVFEASKRRDIVVSLLDAYKKYFKYAENSDLNSFDDYVLHKDYYLSVDMVTAIIFFNNIFLLKERLKLDNDMRFSEIETSFFFFTIYNLVFETPEFVDAIKSLTFYSSKHLRILPLMFRFDNFNNINNFSKILHDININKDNVVTRIPECEIDAILHSHPTIKNFLEMVRLLNFIKICKSITFVDVESVLVIERVLQVIGECLAPKEKEDYSFKRFLSLCLPKEIAHVLRRLRNTLTHLKGHAFPSKFKCEKNTSLFRSILKEIGEIGKYFKSVYHIIILSFSVHLIKQYETELERIKESAQVISLSLLISTLVTKEVTLSINFRSYFLKRITLSCHNFLEMSLINLEDEIEEELHSSNTNVGDVKQKIMYKLWPLKWFFELLKQCEMHNTANLLKSFTNLETSHFDCLNDLKVKANIFIKKCYDFLQRFDDITKKNTVNTLKSVEHIEYFLKNLKGFVYLSEEEKAEIKNEIPKKIKEQISMKNILIQSIKDDFTLQVDVYSADFHLTYLSRKKMKALQNLYEIKDPSVLTILKSQDPIEELEEIFSKNSVDKKKYDKLCEIMEFSEKTRKKLGVLVAGQRKIKPANNLINLLNRVQLLKTIIIDEDEEIKKLWLRVKGTISRQLIEEKIVRRYLKDFHFQTAIEMLLFDCMILFEGVKLPENLWIKPSKLFQGINMRNIISHGNPLVENLCFSLDPQELPLEIIKNILILIRGEDAMKAILELYENVNNNITKVFEIINANDYENIVLRSQIRACNEWKNYALLLPDTHREKVA